MGQFEWESSNLHIAYPFEQPGIDGMNDAFADAVIIDTQQYQRVCLQSLTIANWTYEDISAFFCYEDSSPFFPYDPSVELYTYGMWTLARFFAAGKEIQLILNNQRALPISADGRYVFVARVQECDPQVVKSIEVIDGVTQVTHVFTGDIELAAGYNITLQTGANSFSSRAGAAVSTAAIPGAGVGVAPSDCQPELVLRSINTVGPNEDGKFVLKANECYRAIIPSSGSPDPTVFNPTLAMVQLFNDCGQCCTCADYENCYKALNRLHDKGRNTGTRMARVMDDFNDLNKEITKQKDKRQIPTMDLLLRPTPGYVMGIQINLLNNSTAADLLMNKDKMETVLLKMFITSKDVQMSGAKIVPPDVDLACYLFNSRYGNPWKHVKETDILLDPVSFTSEDGVGVIVKSDIESNVFWHVIKTTQFLSLFLEIGWPSDSASEGDEIKVKLVSKVFSPYTLTKTETLIKPYGG